MGLAQGKLGPQSRLRKIIKKVMLSKEWMIVFSRVIIVGWGGAEHGERSFFGEAEMTIFFFWACASGQIHKVKEVKLCWKLV